MWFKNLQLFRFTKPFELPAETLDEVLAKRPFRTCGPLELASAGWSAPWEAMQPLWSTPPTAT